MSARLDETLVAQGHFATRSRARDAVLRGTVAVNGVTARKPGQAIAEGSAIAVADAAQGYVSRGALKLLAGLDHFGFSPAGHACLDLGASTGGFTQVLLERGAARVLAVDVGHGQMADGLRADGRVACLEGLNARDLAPAHLDALGAVPDFLVSDLSFISLKLALPPALALAAPGARALLLVKPQFEAGRTKIGKGGVLRDPADAPGVAEDLRSWLDAVPGWRALGLADSPIAGSDGNREFLLAGAKDRGA